jgi:hypothetical protein
MLSALLAASRVSRRRSTRFRNRESTFGDVPLAHKSARGLLRKVLITRGSCNVYHDICHAKRYMPPSYAATISRARLPASSALIPGL